jgi:hypothetical protein
LPARDQPTPLVDVCATPASKPVYPNSKPPTGGGITLKSLRRIERQQTHMVATEIRLRTYAVMYRVPEVWLYAGDLAGKRLTPNWYRPEADAA